MQDDDGTSCKETCIYGNDQIFLYFPIVNVTNFPNPYLPRLGACPLLLVELVSNYLELVPYSKLPTALCTNALRLNCLLGMLANQLSGHLMFNQPQFRNLDPCI